MRSGHSRGMRTSDHEAPKTDWKVVSPWSSDWEPTSADARPQLDDSRPRLDESEAAKVVTYLEAGSFVSRMTRPSLPDPLSGSETPVVPVSIRTDGEWIWNDSLTYFVKMYRIAPTDEFMRYLRSRDFEPRPSTEADVRAAWEAIQAS
jgi:hypothetical protein